MADDRRMAADPPQRSASRELGPHLLGRIYTPDARDWSMGKLRELAEPPDAILGQTVQQVIDSKTYFSDWRSYLVFWHWLNKKKKPAKKDPGGWALNVQLDQGQNVGNLEGRVEGLSGDRKGVDPAPSAHRSRHQRVGQAAGAGH